MKTKKTGMFLLVTVSIFLLLSQIAFARETRLVMSTSATGGAWFLFGGALSKVVSKHVPDVSATAKPSASSIENIRNVGRNRVDIGMAMPDAAYNAYNGKGSFEKEKYEGIRALFSIFGADIYLYTLKDNSDIKKVADFQNRRVAVGAAGSGTEVCNRLILDHYGMSYDDVDEVFLSAPEAVMAMKDGSLDAAMYSHATPHSLILDLTASRDITFIEMGEEQRAKFLEKYPYYSPSVVKAGTYTGQDKDYNTFAYHGMIIVNEKMDDELAYNIVKAVFENKPEIDHIHAKFKEIVKESALKGIKIPLHPGAERYWREQGLIQ
ncbi:TAXI family TRAP transporter solute-binding subunit [Desulforhopalus singaporensis]|uniref:TRAP transporter solute receptor, TAXI family n=1 Tax=Desulforhopalus singaporensis TaxID=91360 RepID=A0A1H0VFC0_9BACT|nr:TAXI family TRAP transporter solute-binding subunit [Desulforhopalus singaporensis]SDP76766.1 hypothetical protein SAMN05660330_04019 [Desulforhopalus singaporensis]